jgi:hypothetical protein
MGTTIDPVAGIRRIRGQVKHEEGLVITFGKDQVMNAAPPEGLKWTVEITVNIKEQDDD